MNEDKLAESLHDTFSEVAVGPAPLQKMHTDARRIRRTRFTAVTSAAVAVVAVAGFGAWSVLNDGNAAKDVPAATPVAPAGLKYVGIDGVLVAVPDSWVQTTKATSAYCGSEVSDVIAYNAPDCDENNQDAVHLLRKRPAGVSGWQPVEIDGELARRTKVRVSYEAPDDGEPTVWTSQVFVNGVVVSVISSRGESDVDRLLDSVALR